MVAFVCKKGAAALLLVHASEVRSDMPRGELSVGRAFAYQDHTMVSDVINGVENRRAINYVQVAASEVNGKLLSRSEKLFGS